jgi:hypothetical protein
MENNIKPSDKRANSQPRSSAKSPQSDIILQKFRQVLYGYKGDSKPQKLLLKVEYFKVLYQ